MLALRQISKAPPGQGWAPTSVALSDARRRADTALTATLAHAGPSVTWATASAHVQVQEA